MQKVNILNASIHNVSRWELLEKLRHGGFVITPNVDHIIKLQKDPEFHHIYRQADYVVCDSTIVLYASRFLGAPIKEKISGSDLFPAFYNYYKDDPQTTIFLLGAAPGVAQKAQENINHKVGRKIIVDVYSPSYGFENNEAECEKIIDLINDSKATVLAVGVGAPKQEKWIYKYKHKFKYIKTFLAIGATIDFEAGNIQRSPTWMSELGAEWLHRLMSEPQRLWKRYLVDDLPFFWLILQQKLNLYQYRLPIGQILLEADLLSEQQIAKILQEQAERKLRFGELITEKAWLKPETVNFFVDTLPQLSQIKARQPLGQYLKQAALLNDLQIEEIIMDQHKSNLYFGEIAINKGWVKPKTLDLLLHYLPTNSQAQTLTKYEPFMVT